MTNEYDKTERHSTELHETKDWREVPEDDKDIIRNFWKEEHKKGLSPEKIATLTLEIYNICVAVSDRSADHPAFKGECVGFFQFLEVGKSDAEHFSNFFLVDKFRHNYRKFFSFLGKICQMGDDLPFFRNGQYSIFSQWV